MRKHDVCRPLRHGAWAAWVLVGLSACNDYLTGQDGEPRGPLKVTRLTLSDLGKSRGAAVVTDTSVPPDCSADAAKDLYACQSDPFKDKYGILRSPPNPDSAGRLRVVFNKSPLKLNGKELEPLPETGLPKMLALSDPNVLKLVCTRCSQDDKGNQGVPASYNSLQNTGTDQSPNPARFAYGPGLQMEVLTSCEETATAPCLLSGLMPDPYRALEPDATYSVILDPGLSARLGDGSDNVLLDDAARALLTFPTEPFKLLTIGIGDAADNRVDGAAGRGDGSAERPYQIDRPKPDAPMESVPVLDNAGAVQVRLNAAVDESVFTAQTATATVTVGTGAAMAVPVTLSNATGASRQCSFGDKRRLYIAPTAGTWLSQPMPDAVVRITLRGSELRDLSQLPGHPAGKGVHAVAREINLEARLLAESAGPNYRGVQATAVVPLSQC